MRDRFLVTGAAGFVGARLCRALAERGEDVHALVGAETRTWRLDDEKRIVRHPADLRDAAAVRGVIEAVRPTVVYNLATHGAYPHQTDARRVIDTNVIGLTNLLEACETIDYRLFVHTGSSSEYGRKSAPMRENDLLEPESVYGVSKAAQSLLCRQWAARHGRPIVVFRLFSVYGPFEEPTRLIPRLLGAALDDAPLDMASPRTSRDFVYIDDVVAALSGVERLAALSGAILNLGTGVQTNLAEVVQTLELIAGKLLAVRWEAMASRPWDTDVWVADTTALRSALGWTPPTRFREGLAQSLDWMRDHRRFYPGVLPQ